MTAFSVAVPLTNGANNLSIVGLSRTGQPVAGASNDLVVSYSGTIPPPVGHVVLNEIMWNPSNSGAQFVELCNNSTTATYDLSGWQLQGLSYTFPRGSLLPPLGFLVLAGNIPAFAAAYGSTNAVFDTFSGTLSPGQILSLEQPSGTNYQVVAKVKFDDVLPWPTNTSIPGVSLQLIDSQQDNWRVGNWSTATTKLATPDATNNVATSLPVFPPLWINEVEPDNLTGLTNSAGEPAPWLELFNPSTNTVALGGLYLGCNYTNLPPDWSYGSLPDGQSFVRISFYSPTPGASNAVTGLPSSSVIVYNMPGSIYTQNFDSLPDPGATSVNSANPVTINGVTYSLGNPFDFAAPAAASGKTGGLGLAAMAGWYGLADPAASVGTRLGASDGDQTAGGQISFGLPNSSNRALGLEATSTTGYTAFGAKFINNTDTTLNYLNVQATGEIWRQSDKAKTLKCYYFIDPTVAAPISTAATASLPTLDVSFPAVPADVGGGAVDGTNPANQMNLAITNQAITNWPPGAAWWLVWEMADATGKAQGLAIDNLSFSATSQNPSTNTVSLTLQSLTANQFVLSWPAVAANFQLYTTTNLASPVMWNPATNAPALNNGTNSVTIATTNAVQFFHLLEH
ncbi:MAG: lamin tail domain-containing protein [Limisphaerales bacterium]